MKVATTGALYRTREESRDALMHQMCFREKHGHIYQYTDRELSAFKPVSGWLLANEPEDHLDLVAERLQSSVRTVDKIICFSYKDLSLAMRLKQGWKTGISITTLFGIDEGVIGDHAEDIEEVSIAEKMRAIGDCSNSLFLIRHYLEHFREPKRLIQAIAKLTGGQASIYVEVPSCQQLLAIGNPIVFWEQHRQYFTEQSLRTILEASGCSIQWLSSHGIDMEPSLACLVNTRLTGSRGDETEIDQKEGKEVGAISQHFVEKWKSTLRGDKELDLYCVGVGHNLDRFLQVVGVYDMIAGLIDDDVSKHGYFLYGVKKPISGISAIPAGKEINILLGVHDRSAMNVTRKLKTRLPKAHFFSIFSTGVEINV